MLNEVGICHLLSSVVLMSAALSGKRPYWRTNVQDRHDHYPQVEHETLASHILGVIGNFQGNFELIPGHLPVPTGKAGRQNTYAGLGSCINEVVLVE